MLNFKLSQEDKDIFIALECNAEMQPIKEPAAMQAFRTSEYAAAYFLKEEFSQFVELVNAHIESIKNGIEKESQLSHKIAEIRNAKVSVSISPDKMTGKLKVEAACGGESPGINDVKEACKLEGIKYGLKRSKVEALLVKSEQAKPGDIIEGDIAFGKLPENGKNARFEALIELFSDKLRKPTELEGGKVDLRDLGDIDTVKPGQKVFKKIPLTEGTPGKNVVGDELPAKPGKDIKLEVTQGTIFDDTDPNILVASREGLARVIENRMEVDNVYTLEELTPKEGHVQFNGTVIIKGDVSPEMKIVATGDVVVGGFVESASIRSQGEITVMGGASGKALHESLEGRKYNCLLESGNRINIAFANNIDIKAKRDVFVHKQLSHCFVVAGSIVVGQGLTPNGKLIGGTLEVSKSVEVGYLGAPAGAETKISLNRTYKIFKQKEEKLWEKMQPYMEDLEKLKVKLKMLMTDEQKEKPKAKIAALEAFVEKLTIQRKKLIQRRRDYMASLEVQVYHTLYSGTQIELGSKVISNDRERGPSIIKLNESLLEVVPK